MTWGGKGTHEAHNAKVQAWTNLGRTHLTIDDSIEAIESVVNDGDILLDTSPSAKLVSGAPPALLINGNVNLTGKGTITLAPSPGSSAVITGKTGNDTLTNSNTIQGTGIIGNKSMNLVNTAKGQILANTSLPLVISMGPGNTFTNTGVLFVAANGGQGVSLLTLTGPFQNFNARTATLAGGVYNIAGTLQFDNANIVNNAANLTLAGQIVNQNNVNALANFANNSASGSFTLLPPTFSSFTSAGPFTNKCQLMVTKGSKFTVGASGKNYNQGGGTTSVDGVLAVSTGGLIKATAGALQGAGTFSGSVSVGNASGAIAMFLIGDSIKKAGLISIANDYTQLATGAMDVQIGGKTAGTQYSQLNVTGAVKLSGTLNISRINNFTPQVGQTFTILTSPTSLNGTFSTVNGTKINSNEHFKVSYPSSSVVLTVESGPAE